MTGSWRSLVLVGLLLGSCRSCPPPGVETTPEPTLERVEVDALRVNLAAPIRIQTIDDRVIEVSSFIEFSVRMPVPRPEESVSLVLRIGDRNVEYGKALSAREARYIEYEPAMLEEGATAAVYWGYEEAQPLYRSDYRYDSQSLRVVQR